MTALQSRAEQTRTHLLETAAECFVEGGYDATSVALICGRAGVSKGAFYHHFPSKQALFLALLDYWLTDLDSQMNLARLGATSVPQGLVRMAEMVRAVFEMPDSQVRIFFEFFNQAQRDEKVWQQAIEPYRRYRSFFAELIEMGVAEGSLRPVDPELAAQMLVSLAVGLLMQSVLDPRGADWGQVAQGAVRLLLDGLQA